MEVNKWQTDKTRMKELFPNCPICGSSNGYETSLYYPRIFCKSCQAEWILSEDGLELRQKSRMGWDFELLYQKKPLDFWKDYKGPDIGERMFAPIVYQGGHTSFEGLTGFDSGFFVLRHDSLTYKTTESSIRKMNFEIPIQRFKGIEIRTGKDITFFRWFLIGQWSILFKKKREYLVLEFEDISGMEQHMVFDFHEKRDMADELISLLTYLKVKKAEKPNIAETPSSILKIRYARGEITKEQYEEMKRTLES